MKKQSLFIFLIMATPTCILSSQKGKIPAKTSSADETPIDFPTVKIVNQSKTKATITAITIQYKIADQSAIKSVTTAAKIPLPANNIKKPLQFTPRLLLPTSQKSVTPLGVSEIKVETDLIKISPPWTQASQEPAICINQDGTTWKLDPCDKKVSPKISKKIKKSIQKNSAKQALKVHKNHPMTKAIKQAAQHKKKPKTAQKHKPNMMNDLQKAKTSQPANVSTSTTEKPNSMVEAIKAMNAKKQGKK